MPSFGRDRQRPIVAGPDYTETLVQQWRAMRRLRTYCAVFAGIAFSCVIATLLLPNPPWWLRAASIFILLLGIAELRIYHASVIREERSRMVWKYEQETARLMTENLRLWIGKKH